MKVVVVEELQTLVQMVQQVVELEVRELIRFQLHRVLVQQELEGQTSAAARELPQVVFREMESTVLQTQELQVAQEPLVLVVLLVVHTAHQQVLEQMVQDLTLLEEAVVVTS